MRKVANNSKMYFNKFNLVRNFKLMKIIQAKASIVFNVKSRVKGLVKGVEADLDKVQETCSSLNQLNQM
jgi:hypothetical protein